MSVSRKQCARSVVKGLQWTPRNENEWVSWNSQSSWYRQFPQMTDEEAGGLLQRILTLRSKRLKSSEPEQREIREVQTLIVKLFEGTAGWAFADELAILGLGIDARFHPVIQRQIAATWLNLPLPLVPSLVRRSLARGLGALNEGNIEPILERSVGGPRGVEPFLKGEIQSWLLAWIEWRAAKEGWGGKTRANNEVTRACGLLSSQALDRWRKDNPHPELLEEAREIGHRQSQGKTKLPLRLRDLAARLEELRVDTLAKRLKEASRPRSK